jgi:ferredoxin
MDRVCAEEKVKLVKFDKRRWRQKFPLTTWLDECDHLISLPKFKTHDLTLLTGAIKNLFGLVSGTYKTELHKNYFDKEDFAKILVDIFQEARPTLTIVDAILAMEGDGPATSGKLRNLNLLLAGSDCVALDAVMALIMGVKPTDVLSTREAAKRDLGAADINSIEILGQNLKDVLDKPFLLPTTTSIRRNIPKPIINIAKKLIKYYPCVERDNCIACAACIQACPTKVISMKNKRIVIDYSKCIACFCCQEACPAGAIKVKKSLLARMIGL